MNKKQPIKINKLRILNINWNLLHRRVKILVYKIIMFIYNKLFVVRRLIINN